MRLGIGILLVAVLCVECSVASGQQQSADKRHVEQNKQIVGFNCNYTSFEQGMIPLDHSKCKTKRKITKKLAASDLLLLRHRKAIQTSVIICKIRVMLAMFYCSGCNIIQTCTQPRNHIMADIKLDYSQCRSLYYNNTVILRNMVYYGNPVDHLEIVFENDRRDATIHARGQRDMRGWCSGESFYMLNEKYMMNYVLEINVNVDTRKAQAEFYPGEDLIVVEGFYRFENYSGELALRHKDLGTIVLEENDHSCSREFEAYYFNQSKIYKTEDNTLIVQDDLNQTFVFQMFNQVTKCGRFAVRETSYRSIFLCVDCNGTFEAISLVTEALITELRIATQSTNFLRGKKINENFVELTDEVCEINTFLASLHWQRYLDKVLDTPHGLTGQIRGDVIYFKKCKEVKVIAGGHTGCYQDLQVLFGQQKYFLEKGTAILKNNSTKIECDSSRAAKYRAKTPAGAIIYICEYPLFYNCTQPTNDLSQRMVLQDVNQEQLPYLFADKHYAMSIYNKMKGTENLYHLSNAPTFSKNTTADDFKKIYNRNLNVLRLGSLENLIPGIGFLFQFENLSIRPFEIYCLTNLIIYVIFKTFVQPDDYNVTVKPACGVVQWIKFIIMLSLPALFACQRRQVARNNV